MLAQCLGSLTQTRSTIQGQWKWWMSAFELATADTFPVKFNVQSSWSKKHSVQRPGSTVGWQDVFTMVTLQFWVMLGQQVSHTKHSKRFTQSGRELECGRGWGVRVKNNNNHFHPCNVSCTKGYLCRWWQRWGLKTATVTFTPGIQAVHRVICVHDEKGEG